MEKFNLRRFLTEGEPKMLCMICKRIDCKKQTCPGDDCETNLTSGGYTCPYFQTPSIPVSDDQAYEVMCDIYEMTYVDDKRDDPETITRQREFRRCYMERVLVELLKQYGFSKTTDIFTKQFFDAPF